MTIRADGSSLVITLSAEEAKAVFVDHGEGFIAIPCGDSLGAIMDINEELRAIPRHDSPRTDAPAGGPA